MRYTVDYFIKKFEAIPYDQWTTGLYVRGKRKCALGHCGVNFGFSLIHENKEASALREILIAAVPAINDGTRLTANATHRDFRKLGDNPKDRILTALLYAKAGIWKEMINTLAPLP